MQVIERWGICVDHHGVKCPCTEMEKQHRWVHFLLIHPEMVIQQPPLEVPWLTVQPLVHF